MSERLLKFSWFHSFRTKYSESCECSWDSFVSILNAYSQVEGYKPNIDDYQVTQPLLSPAIYGDNKKRSNNNVLGWDIAMMDIDDVDVDLEYIQEHFKDYNYIIYSSAGCTVDKLKLRVMIPLDEFAPSDVLSQIWHGCNEWCDGIIDKQTKDKSRLYYIPSEYTNKGKLYRHIFLSNKGKNLNWKELIDKYPSPKERDKYIVQNKLSKLKRKIYLNNKKQPIMDIQNRDCPFVYLKMIEEYLLTPAGNHHKAIYTFMVKVCYNAQKIEYPLSLDELVQMAEQLDQLDGGFYDDKKLYDSAKDAMTYTGI